MGSDGDRSEVTLQIKLASDRSTKSVQIDLCQTVEEFKRFLAQLTGIPSGQQILVYMGRYLDNSRKLASYEMEPNQTVHLVQCSGKNTMPLSGTYALDGTSGSDKKPQSASKVVGESLSHENHQVDIQHLFPDLSPDEIAFFNTLEFGSIDDLNEIVDESFWPENHEVNTEKLVGDAFDRVNWVKDSMQEALFGCATAAVCGCNSTSEYHSFPGDNGLDGNDKEPSEKMIFAAKLAVMEQRGLKDRNRNIRALLESWEDVEMAVRWLENNPNPDEEERS